MSRFPLRVRVAAALGILLAVVLGAPALADHGNWAIPDDEIHYIDEVALTANGNAASDWGQARLDGTQISTPAGTADVEVRDWVSQANAHLFGWAECTKWWTYSCDKYQAVFNQLNMDGRPLAQWQSLGCHELGHTAGLDHRFPHSDTDTNSCMQELLNSTGWPRYYDQHDINEINGNVPPGDDD